MTQHVAHTLAGFTASFMEVHKRTPTLQEIFDGGVKAGRDLNFPAYQIPNDPMNWLNAETVMAAVKSSGLVLQYSCCSTPLKFCATDMWRGELRAYSIALLREAKEYLKKKEPTPA